MHLVLHAWQAVQAVEMLRRLAWDVGAGGDMPKAMGDGRGRRRDCAW